MAWILSLALFAALFWRARKAGERTREYAAAGALRSRLYWSQYILLGAMAGLTFAARPMLQSPVAFWAWLGGLALTLVALIFVRRALKWRYPI
jgi:hypothetical protein